MTWILLAAGLVAALPPGPPADSITIARLQYDGGGDWYANPSSLPNLLEAVRERTGIAVAQREASIAPLDPGLRDHPYLYMTGHGNVRFSPPERAALREYLVSGGFLTSADRLVFSKGETTLVIESSDFAEVNDNFIVFLMPDLSETFAAGDILALHAEKDLGGGILKSNTINTAIRVSFAGPPTCASCPTAPSACCRPSPARSSS